MPATVLLSIALAYFAGAGSGPILAQEPGSPLMDGRCNEYATLAQEHHALAPQVDLHVFQDDDYVWLCYSLPPESHGTLDMYIDAPRLAQPLNLHVSAQLGEWPADGEGPSGARSEQWWQVDGWWANTAHFNGSRGEGENRRPYFRPSEGRELQMSKEHFGRGEWRLQLDIQGLEVPGGRIIFPEDVGDEREVMTVVVH